VLCVRVGEGSVEQFVHGARQFVLCCTCDIAVQEQDCGGNMKCIKDFETEVSFKRVTWNSHMDRPG
jgi:hypothetical protein